MKDDGTIETGVSNVTANITVMMNDDNNIATSIISDYKNMTFTPSQLLQPIKLIDPADVTPRDLDENSVEMVAATVQDDPSENMFLTQDEVDKRLKEYISAQKKLSADDEKEKQFMRHF